MLLIICVVTLELSACDAAERSMDESMTVQATIIEIEKYGHAVLDITTADFAAAGSLSSVWHIRHILLHPQL